MNTPALRTPRHWFRVSKYLLPIGLNYHGLPREQPPQEQVPVAQLAAEHPESVSLFTLGNAELLSEFAYDCYSSGNCKPHILQTKLLQPAYVAELQDGISFGRHCCVIGPAGKAIRETGFNLDGMVVADKVPVSLLRLRYWRKRWEGDVTSRPWLPPKQRIEGRVAVVNKQFSHNFYHWLIEVLPRLATLRRAGLTADYYLVECLTKFQQNVLAALGIEQHQLIQPHCRLLLEAKQLLVPSFPTPACLREFRDLIVTRLEVKSRVGAARRIFITRRNTGTRTIVNEIELENLLHTHHFETHSMEEYPLSKQAQLIHEAELIVGMHGAGLANLLFARPGTRVIEIVPTGRYNAACYPEKSRIFGLHHQQVFADRARRGRELQVSLDDVATALFQADRQTHRSTAA